MKNILVALDGSPRARLVLDSAIRLAKSMDAKITLHRSVGIPPEIPLNLYLGSTGDLAGVLLDNAKKELAEFSALVPPELLGGEHVMVATAWDGICRTAAEMNADAIVIGSHGFGGLDRLLGTTAARVVNHADCSVLVVRPPREG